jgi:hypothetical protein
MERIGDILVVHGGISPELLQLDLSVPDINDRARPFYKLAYQTFNDPLLNIVFNSNNSPFWYRGYYQPDTLVTEEIINATLQHFGVKTIVTGHTIVNQVTPYYNGKVININTNHAAGHSESLLIKNRRFYRVQGDGKRERIK